MNDMYTVIGWFIHALTLSCETLCKGLQKLYITNPPGSLHSPLEDHDSEQRYHLVMINEYESPLVFFFCLTNSWSKYQKFSLRHTTGICKHWIVIFISIQMFLSARRDKNNCTLICIRIFTWFFPLLTWVYFLITTLLRGHV